MDLREIRTINTANRHPWEEARLAVIIDQLKQLRTKEPKILDYGCGDAYVAEKLASIDNEIKIDAFDISFSSEFLTIKETFLRNNDLKIRLCNSIEKLDSDYDVVLLLDVMEHISDDQGVLKEMLDRKIISSKTTVIVTVPAFQMLFSRRDNYLGHFRRYNKKSLNGLFQSAGFKGIKSQYFFFSLILPRIANKLLEIIFNTKDEGIGDYKGNRLFSVLVKKFLIADYHTVSFLHMLKIPVPGLSLLAIYRLKNE